AANRKNSTPIIPNKICTYIGILPSSFGPIKLNFSGKRDGSITKSNHSGKRYKDAKTAINLTHLIKVPTAGACLNSSACSKLSKNVVGKMTTLGVLSTVTT